MFNILKPFHNLHLILVAATLAVFFAPAASAQRLDNVWFKLRLAAKGRTLDSLSTAARLNFARPMYMQFVATNDAPHRYTIHVWTLRNEGWTNATTVTRTLIGANENFISDLGLTLPLAGSDFVHIYHTVFISSKTNSTGQVIQAIYDGAGEIDLGSISGKDYYGGCFLKGTLINPSKLPFLP